jgi:hypothetical protein
MDNLGHTDTKAFFTVIYWHGTSKVVSGPRHHKRAAEELIRLREAHKNEQAKTGKVKRAEH